MLTSGKYVFTRVSPILSVMSDSDFVELVQQAAALESPTQAASVAEATLQELGRNISPGEADDLAERLPATYGRALTDVDNRHASPVSLEEFLSDIAGRTDLTGDIRATIRGVMGAVAAYAGADELTNAAAQLPPEYGAVLEPGSVPIAETFVDAVQAETVLDDNVETATAATLSVLGRRLSKGEAEDIAAYLHGDAAEWLIQADSTDPEDIAPDEFLTEVAATADVDTDEARAYVTAVSETLDDVVPDRELDRAMAQLPDSYTNFLHVE